MKDLKGTKNGTELDLVGGAPPEHPKSTGQTLDEETADKAASGRVHCPYSRAWGSPKDCAECSRARTCKAFGAYLERESTQKYGAVDHDPAPGEKEPGGGGEPRAVPASSRAVPNKAPEEPVPTEAAQDKALPASSSVGSRTKSSRPGAKSPSKPGRNPKPSMPEVTVSGAPKAKCCAPDAGSASGPPVAEVSHKSTSVGEDVLPALDLTAPAGSDPTAQDTDVLGQELAAQVATEPLEHRDNVMAPLAPAEAVTPVQETPGRRFIREETIQIDCIVVGDEPEVRGVNPENVERLQAALEAGHQLPPVTVDVEYRLVDGAHTCKATKLAGRETVTVRVYEYQTALDRLLHAVERNVAHGMPLLRRDTKKIAVRLYAAKMSIGEISSLLATPVRTIQSWVQPVRQEHRKALAEEATDMAGLGMSHARIAQLLKVTEKQVRGLLCPKRKSAERAERTTPGPCSADTAAARTCACEQAQESEENEDDERSAGCEQQEAAQPATTSWTDPAAGTQVRETVRDRLDKLVRLVEDADRDFNRGLLGQSLPYSIYDGTEALLGALEHLLDAIQPSGGSGKTQKQGRDNGVPVSPPVPL